MTLSSNNFLNKKFLVIALSIVLPVAAQILLQSLLGMADVTMVGSLGDSAVAAIGLAAKLHFLLLVFMNGIATASSILIAQYLGAARHDDCQRVLVSTLIVGIVTAFPFIILFSVAENSWLPWLNPDPNVVALAGEYLRITAITILFVQIIVVFESALRSLGQTSLSLVAAIISIVLNISCNYVLIFGKWGFPELGVEGAAWGTLIARLIQVSLFLLWFELKNHRFKCSTLPYKAGLEIKTLKAFIIFGLPLVINYLMWAIGNTLYHVLTGFSGTAALAVMGIMVPLEMCLFSIFIGFSSASSVLIGQTLGAGDKQRAWDLFRFFDRLAIIVVATICTSVWFLKDFIIQLYADLDIETRDLLRNVIQVFCLTFWIRVMNLMRIVGVLRAGGDTKFCLWLDLAVMWLLGIPVYAAAIFISPLNFAWIYALIFLEDIAKIIPVHWRLKGKRWMRNLTQENT